MEPKFTQEQSIELIKVMIQQAKNNAKDRLNLTNLILWGYAIFTACLLHFVVQQLEVKELITGYYGGYIWGGIVIITFIITIVIILKGDKSKKVTTYTDTIVNNAWIGFGIGTTIIVIMLFGKANLYYPTIALLYAFPIYITSIAYKSKVLIISAIIIVACVISYKFIPHESYYPIPMAIAMLCGNIIPGHIFKLSEKKNDKGA